MYIQYSVSIICNIYSERFNREYRLKRFFYAFITEVGLPARVLKFDQITSRSTRNLVFIQYYYRTIK